MGYNPITTKPWGEYEVLSKGDDFKVKILRVTNGQRLSLQRHNLRDEYWTILKGTAKITAPESHLGNEEIRSNKIMWHRASYDERCALIVYELQTGQSTTFKRQEIHRVEAVNGDLEILEIQKGYCGEGDIERLEDDYDR